jgi:hypothetical protein
MTTSSKSPIFAPRNSKPLGMSCKNREQRLDSPAHGLGHTDEQGRPIGRQRTELLTQIVSCD